jgi:hypothetical protein
MPLKPNESNPETQLISMPFYLCPQLKRLTTEALDHFTTN